VIFSGNKYIKVHICRSATGYYRRVRQWMFAGLCPHDAERDFFRMIFYPMPRKWSFSGADLCPLRAQWGIFGADSCPLRVQWGCLGIDLRPLRAQWGIFGS
jgi:hypothetical protein